MSPAADFLKARDFLLAHRSDYATARRGFRWGTLFWSAVGGLVLLGSGLGIVNLVEDLFARNQTLGYVALAFAVAAALALTVVIAREAFGMMRLAAIEKLPANATIEDAIERLVFLTKIERGLTEVLQKFCLRSVTPADRGPLHGRSTSDDAPA